MRKQTYDFESKRLYRQKLKKYIATHFPDQNRRRNLTVACFPGHEGLEVTEVYLPLGIRPNRIYGIEQDQEAARLIAGLDLKINVINRPAKDYFATTPERFDIVNLDFQSQFGEDEEAAIRSLFLLKKARSRMILGTNFYGARENKERQRAV